MKPSHYAEYFALRAFWGICGLLPLDTASNLGSMILRKIGPLMGINRIARRNIAHVFPGWDQARTDAVLLDMWDNLGRVIAEYPHLARIAATRVTYKNKQYLDTAVMAGKPVLFLSGHLANWEVLPAALKENGILMHSVYRAPNNPAVDRLLVKTRSLGGVLNSFGKNARGMREVIKMLANGGHIGMLIDQKFNQGPDIPFFGMPARTTLAYIDIARKTGCTLLPGRIVRTGGSNFIVHGCPPLNIEGKTHEAVALEMHALLEEWIRENPGQWLWTHRRWRF